MSGFWSRVEKTAGCWNWTAGRTQDGYGAYHIGSKTLYAHRVAYELAIGQIPEGLVLDHLCRVRHCVNPKHLEPVANRTNVLRGVGFSAVNASKTHCVNGHQFTEENTYRRGSRRDCRTCKRARFRAWRERQQLRTAGLAS